MKKNKAMAQKRKLQSETTLDNLNMKKVIKLHQNNEAGENMNWSQVEYARQFNFELTDKKAKSNLLKSAGRRHLEIEPKQKSTNLKFSAGAYILVAKPMITKFQEMFRDNTTILKNNMEIQVEDFRDGMDLNEKHVDTKIVLCVNKKKVVIHGYNSTQNIKVDGSVYSHFIEHFLAPAVQSNIDKMKTEINDYDKNVYTTFAARGRPLRPRSVKNIRSIINQQQFNCKKCDNKFESYTQFKKHKFAEHSKSFDSSQTSIFSIKQSTRNNSMTGEMLLCEDITINLDEKTMEEENITPGTPAQNDVRSEQSKSCKIIAEDIDIKTKSEDEDKKQGTDIVHHCYLCEYTTKDEKSLKIHGNNAHGIVDCYKCSYSAEDQDILDNHMKKHTGKFIFQCRKCEFEATREYLLENHMEAKHEKTNSELANPKCEKCGKKFPLYFLSRYHICGPQYTYPCQVCAFVAIDLEEIINHIRRTHVKELTPNLKCEECEYTTMDKTRLDIHKQTSHMELKIDISVKDQIVIQCEQCEFTCRLNIQLKKHMKSVHIKENNELRFKCGSCEFASHYVLQMWQHRQTVHPDKEQKFKPKPQDMVSTLLAEQGFDLLEEMETMKKDIKGSFIELTKGIGAGLVEASNEMNGKFQEIQATIDQLSKKIDKISTKKEEETTTPAQNDEEKVDSKKPQKVLKEKEETKNIKKEKNTFDIAWVGSSISKAMDVKKFEKDTKSVVKFVRAYGIEEENERAYEKESLKLINKTLKKVVPEVLEENDVDVLVLQTGSIEISNIKVNEAVMDTNKVLSEYKTEWFDKVEKDSKNVFKIAEEAIKQKPGLKVVIIKRLPRFDRSSQDILNIKSSLSKFANSVFDQMWTKRGSPNNIKIIELSLNIEESSYLRDLIYGSKSSQHFDGIHLHGPGASRHFTYRAVQALRSLLPHNGKPLTSTIPRPRTSRQTATKPEMGNHTDCPQARYQSHTDCPQARYQRQHQVEQGRSYADAVRSYKYSVSTSNRFNPLN